MINRPVWDDSDDVPLPRLSGVVEADICVVGLGGSGLAAVDELLQAGRSVVGVDAGPVASGAAGRNGGFLLAGMAHGFHRLVDQVGGTRAAAMYQATLDEIDAMAATTPDAIRRCGSVRLATSAEEEADCDAQLLALRAAGFEAELFESPPFFSDRARPNRSVSEKNGVRGLLFPADGSLQPLRRCRALARRAVEEGALLFGHSPVVSVAGDRVTVAGGGEVRCGAVVVAVDGGLERLLPELAGRVRRARLQMLATAPLPDMPFPRPVYARWGYDYWQQLPDGTLALGGCRDRLADQEWTDSTEPSAPVQAALDQLLASLHVQAPVTHRWAAGVGFTPDDLPVLDEVRPGVWACGGYCGTGNVVGALCGRAAARLAIGLPSPWAELLTER